MPQPYSYDLRQKVLQAIQQDGLKKCEASQLFRISRNTIDLWLKRQAQTGDFQPKPHKPHCTLQKITDWEQFLRFAQEHSEKTQAEMAALWPQPISARSISRALQKIGFTRKKRLTATVNATQLNGRRSSSS